ncbi:AMP-binding protein [Candidatus Woesearchaeota archaeon]|nr:AMP-binding protein [Candidatus Woesearchaeota archaeon]
MLKFLDITTFGQFIEAAAQTYKNRTAIKIRPRFRAVSLSYSDLFKYSVFVAQQLEKAGIRKGDKVLLWAPNSHLWVASFFGIQLKGAVAVPINVQSTKGFISKIIGQTEAKLVIKSSRMPAIKGIETIQIEDVPLLSSHLEFNPEFKKPKINEDDVAEIIYTSGTTGFPKGVVLTHRNILSNVKASLKAIPVSKDDRFLSILPLSHMFEQVGGMLVPLAAGAQVTYATSLNSLSIRKNLVDDKITKIVAVPEFLKLTAKRIETVAEKGGKKKFFDILCGLSFKIPVMQLRRLIFRRVIKRLGSQLRTVVSGGAPLDAEVGKKWEAFGIYVLQGYGTTEASPVISANRYEDRKVASVGKPFEGVEVKLAGDGEILVKGPNVTQGYFKNPKKTRESFADGWYKTGDIGYFGKGDHLYVKGRKEYVIITEAGENVYPEDVEFELNKHKGVKDSAVVGFRRNGRLEVHAVLLGEGIKGVKKPSEVISKVNSKLAAYQQIQGFTVWPFDDFPRTVTKKVRKNEVLAYLKHFYEGKETGAEKSEAKKSEASKEHGIYKILSQVSELPEDKITDDKKLGTDLKLDSLARVELVSSIEEEFGIAVDESEITSETSVAELKGKIETGAQKVEKYEFKEWPLSAAARIIRWFLQQILVNSWLSFYAPTKVEGLENLRNLELPAIFFANHVGGLDAPIAMRALPGRIRNRLAVAAAIDAVHEHPEFAKYAGFLTLLINIYPLGRREQSQIKSSLEYTGRLLDRGFSVLAFPEGRVSRSGKMLPLKEGAGFLAVEMGVPVVPVKLIGAREVYHPKKTFPELPARHDVIVRLGKPLDFSAKDSYVDSTRKIEDALRQL